MKKNVLKRLTFKCNDKLETYTAYKLDTSISPLTHNCVHSMRFSLDRETETLGKDEAVTHIHFLIGSFYTFTVSNISTLMKSLVLIFHHCSSSFLVYLATRQPTAGLNGQMMCFFRCDYMDGDYF